MNKRFLQIIFRRQFFQSVVVLFLSLICALNFFSEQAFSKTGSMKYGRWKTVLVSQDEPGEPLIVAGTVYAPDGKTPAPGVTVYVYHTDAEGYYRKGTTSSSNPRLKGTMITNAEGKYEFRTIKPAPYPGGGNPAHIHYVLSGKDYPKQYDEVMFEGDPYLSANARANAKKDRAFATVQPLTRDKEGVWHCVRDFKLKRD